MSSSSMKELDLFKVLGIATIVCVLIAVITVWVGGFSIDTDSLKVTLSEPLELKNWHFALLILSIYVNGK